MAIELQSSPGLIVSSGLAGLVRRFEGLYLLNLAKLFTLWTPDEGAVALLWMTDEGTVDGF